MIRSDMYTDFDALQKTPYFNFSKISQQMNAIQRNQSELVQQVIQLDLIGFGLFLFLWSCQLQINVYWTFSINIFYPKKTLSAHIFSLSLSLRNTKQIINKLFFLLFVLSQRWNLCKVSTNYFDNLNILYSNEEKKQQQSSIYIYEILEHRIGVMFKCSLLFARRMI